MAVSMAINSICASNTNLEKASKNSELTKSYNCALNEQGIGRSFYNIKKSASNLYINDLILTNCQNFCDLSPRPLISTNTNLYNNQNLRINKVGSYVELRLKRLSASKYFLNDLDLDNKSHKTNRLSYYNERRNSSASTDSFSSIHKSRSRSSSMSSMTDSYYSPFSQDASFRITKPKKLKLVLTKAKMPGLTATSQTAPNISALSKKLATKKSNSHRKIPRSIKLLTTDSKKQRMSKSQKKTIACKNSSSKHNKFSKFSNEDFNLSKSYFSQSSCACIQPSLSNFSMSNINNNLTSANNSRKLKCLLVGDARVGKSALMSLFLKRAFQYEYQPTIVDDYEVKIVLNGESYTLSLFDTAGQEDWETLRVMAYPDTDVILLCFSVVRPDSMENIKTKWMPELNKYLPDALIVLVGTQVDLRESSLTNSNTDPRSRHITQREGEDLKQKIGAFRYIECSALTQLNIKEVFDSCIDAYAKSNPPIQPSCFENLFKRFTQTIRSRFNIRLHSSSSSSSTNNKRNKTKVAKYSKETKYLHE